jgi:hypothetical protein
MCVATYVGHVHMCDALLTSHIPVDILDFVYKMGLVLEDWIPLLSWC